MNKNEINKVKLPSWTKFAILGIISLLVFSWIGIINFFPSWQDRAAFGDMFGGINTLFSGLAFLGVIITIYLQKTELEYQRAELSETKVELERTAKAQENTEKALRSQVESSLIAAKINALKYLMENTKFDEFNDSTAYFKKKDLLDELKKTMNLLDSKLIEFNK